MAKRVQNKPDHQAIKRVSKDLVRAVGGVEAAENFCRADKRRLSEYGLADNDCFMPADVVMDLEAVAHGTPDHPQMTRLLARLAGFTLIALPKVGGVTVADLHAALACAMKESADIHTRVIEALGDGQATAGEAEALLTDAIEAAEAHVRLHALLVQIAGS